MVLPEQKYENNIRTVSGVVSVFPDDVILRVDTSSLCTINLAAIPASKWNTTYKLYIFDSTGSAGTNPITINAALGQTINGMSSVTINTNGAGLIIRILGENRYQASSTVASGGGGTNGHVIEDEGVPLPQRPNLNFIGPGVTAFDDAINNETVVRVIGGIEALSNAQMITLISNNDVIPGQLYRITDASFTHGGVIVLGTTPNSISRECRSLHLNADYQNVGNYGGIIGFTSQLGIWNKFALTYNLGDVVIYNNYHFICTGAVTPGVIPTADVMAWSLLPKNLSAGFTNAQGYIFVVDFAIYDLTLNRIVYRRDVRNNEVDYALVKGLVTFNYFPWGNNLFAYNKIAGSQSFIENLCNCKFEFRDNQIYNSSCYVSYIDQGFSSLMFANVLNNATVDIESPGPIKVNMFGNIINGQLSINGQSPLDIVSNVVESACALSFPADPGVYDPTQVNDLQIFGNILQNGFSASIKNADQTTGPKVFNNNSFSENGIMLIDNWSGTAVFSGNTIQSNLNFVISNLTNNALQGGLNDTLLDNVISTFPVVVDWSNATIFNNLSNVLTLNSSWNYVGRFLCINSSTFNVKQIVNAPLNFPFELVCYHLGAGPNDFRVTYTTVGTAVSNDIVRNFSFTLATIFNFYLSLPESITFINKSNINFVVAIKKWTA